MKSLIKFPIFALLVFTAIEVAVPSEAMAGSTAVETVTDSSSVITIEPPSLSPSVGGSGGTAAQAEIVITASPEVAAAVSGAVSGAASEVTSGEDIPLLGDAAEGGGSSPGLGAATPLPAESREAVDAVFSQVKNTAAISELSQQISKEAGGLDADANDKIVSMLDTASTIVDSPENLPSAIESYNSLIEGLSRQELIALGNSPSFMAVRQILSSGNEALR